MTEKDVHVGLERWPDHWWACKFPERPHDDFGHFKVTCPKCMIALDALARTQPDRILTGFTEMHTASEWAQKLGLSS